MNWKINILWVVNDIKNTSVYCPILEWIVNWIHAINQNWWKGWKILIHVVRSNQMNLPEKENEEIPNIEWFEISDNWAWFNRDNQESFETFRSDYKLLNYWWKWFWRFFYLKFFDHVSYESIYQEEGKYFSIKFNFDVRADDMMSNKEIVEVMDRKQTWTKLLLKWLKKSFLVKLNSQSKTLETLGRKLLEHLLIYFVDEKIGCPEIILTDTLGNRLTLNSLIWDWKDIETFHTSVIKINKKSWENNIEENFWIKIFKIRYWTEWNNVNLCGHNRVVTEEFLWKYIPDFKQQLKEKDKNGKDNNFSIKCYVFGSYLDSWVDTERSAFNFIKDEDLFKEVILEDDIISWVLLELRKIYETFLKQQEEIKDTKVREFINKKAPWYWILYKEFDLNSIDASISDEYLDSKFHALKYKKEIETNSLAREVLKSSDFWSSEKVIQLMSSVSDLWKTELAHYVATRRVCIDIFEKSLEWRDSDTKKYELEDTVHSIIFPTKTDSESVWYKDHNLWIIDERLSFNEYISSDKPLYEWDKKAPRPDILIFNNPIAVRLKNEITSPITIFEFKRPQRKNYDDQDEDPIVQLWEYVEKIRAWKIPSLSSGRPLKVNQTSTPAYCYLICDLTEKIHNFCKIHQLTKSQDDSWYFWYHNWYKMYIEVTSFDKLINDAKLRNEIFFDKLRIN